MKLKDHERHLFFSPFELEKKKTALLHSCRHAVGVGRSNYWTKTGVRGTEVTQTLFYLNPKFNSPPLYGHTHTIRVL